MGFDIYGLSPTNETDVEKPVFPEKFFDLSDNEKDIYYKLDQAYKEAVPGDYWRSNVWWWRSLWSYTCEVCADVMTIKHMDAGAYNDGEKIPKTTAIRMVSKLRKAEKDGYHVKHEIEHKKWQDELPKEKCEICDGTGLRMDKLGKEARKQDSSYTCNGCSGKGSNRNFMAHYPFSADVAVSFRKFIEQSGGFKIC